MASEIILTSEDLLKGVNFCKGLGGGGTTHYGQQGWSVSGSIRKFVKCEIGMSLEGNECYFFTFGTDYNRREYWDKSGNDRAPRQYFKGEAGNKGWPKKDIDEAIAKEGGLKANGFYRLWYLYFAMNSEFLTCENMREWKKFVLEIFPNYVFDDEKTIAEKKRLKDEYATMDLYIKSGKHEGGSAGLSIGNAMIEMARQFKMAYGESITA